MTDFTQTSFGVTTAETCTDGIEMLKACGGDFRIEMAQVAYPFTRDIGGGDTITEHIEIDAWVPVRADTKEAISNKTVGEGFSVFDNHDAVTLANTICRDHDLNFSFMAVTGGGSGLAMQVECPDLSEALNIGGDEHKGFLTIHTAHDGSASLRVTPTVLRMFCRNVLPAITRANADMRKAGGNAYCIRHSKSMESRIASMISTYRAAMGDMVETSDRLRLLTTKRCSDFEAKELWKRVLASDGKDESELSKRAATQRQNKLDTIEMLSKADENKAPFAPGTFFEAIQPLTAFATRGIGTRDRGTITQAERRWSSAHTGAGAALATRTIEQACLMAGV